MSTASAANLLAAAAATSRFVEAARPVRATYRDFVLDTIAVMAAGAAHPSLAPVRTAFMATESVGRCSAVGFAERCPASVAGLVNGAAMTVLQLQDGHRRARGHPMSHVLPAALAIAEEIQASAAAFLDAVMAGYEVSTRIGASLGGMQPLLHDTGTFGCIGAAVAAAHLLGHKLEQTKHQALIEAAIGNAAAIALFPFRDTCMEGATVHHLFVGLGVQNGITAARGALAGLRPSAATLERFFGPRAGEDFNPSLMVEGIDADQRWGRYEIMSAYLKWHPVCAHLGPMLDCIEALRDRLGGFDPAQIKQVQVHVYATALEYDSPNPASDLAARFSFRHAAALSLRFGPLQHDSFADDRLRHPDTETLAAKVTLQAAPRFDALYPANRPARVTLDFSDGSEETAEVLVPKGDGDRALTRTDIDTKARLLMDAAWGAGHYNIIRTLVAEIENVPSPDLPARLGHALRWPFVA